MVLRSAHAGPIGRAIEEFHREGESRRAPGAGGPAAGVERLALADRPRGADADRGRRDPVLPGADGRAGRGHPIGPASALERPLGIRLPRARREPDGRLLPAASRPLRPPPGGGGVYGQPGLAHLLGRPRRLLGVPAVRDIPRRIGAGGVRVVGLGVLRDPPPAPVGLHHGELDALGLGPRLVARLRPGDPAHAVPPGAGADASGPPRPLPARLHDPGRRGDHGPLGDRGRFREVRLPTRHDLPWQECHQGGGGDGGRPPPGGDAALADVSAVPPGRASRL